MSRDDGIDGPPGPLVRPYAITGGRAAGYGLDLVTLVVALRERLHVADCEPEHHEILLLCQRPVSVAEVAARINLPVTVVKVLLADLIDLNYLIFRTPLGPPAARDPRLLQAVPDGIRDI
ncbi:MAG TPA: DUF742 domain-containing protein [Pseudonocardiaceae bacterium]|jgi:hypothetical protein|nr:DUF742 domain-containing protein [Pseudonocardiaceae bacterium]